MSQPKAEMGTSAVFPEKENGMLRPGTLTVFSMSAGPSEGYQLDDVSLCIENERTAIFRATLTAPAGAAVWARAWVSSEEQTLAESASPRMSAGQIAELKVTLAENIRPEDAVMGCMRIESAPLATKHVVRFDLE